MCLVRLVMVGVVRFVRGLGSSCGVWCCVCDVGSSCHRVVMNVDWIVMVCGGGDGDGSDMCVIRVVIGGVVWKWWWMYGLGSSHDGMVVVRLCWHLTLIVNVIG